jgi:hypothetical protein
MPEGSFSYWDDPLKHYVRMEAWLPLCRARLEKIRQVLYKHQPRRLRYFTFCATTAIDVLMLDVDQIIRRDANGRFDNVTFFDYTPENVVETNKRIPGAIGFSGDFINTVLYMDQAEGDITDGDDDSLDPPKEGGDNKTTNREMVMMDQHRKFIRRFPFDVVNLDLEEFLFKQNDLRPGNVVRALRRVFEWQKRPFKIPTSGANQQLNEFSLMFTTQIGPPNISEDYIAMLQQYLESNLARYDGLGAILTGRIGHANVTRLKNEDFDLFFKLAMPKVIANILMENDWYVDPEKGVLIYEFQRPIPGDGHYVMLHLVMDVKRKNPPT